MENEFIEPEWSDTTQGMAVPAEILDLGYRFADVPMFETPDEMLDVPLTPEEILKHKRQHRHKPDQRRKRKHQKRKLKRVSAG